MFPYLLITDLQAAILTEPRERALHHVAELSKTAPMSLGGARQQRHDASLQCAGDIPGGAVSSISLESLRAMTGPPARPLDRRNVVQHRQGRLRVMEIRRRDFDDQRNAFGVRYDVAFTAPFGSIRGVWAGVDPPKTARTEALSMTARERSIAPILPRAFSRTSCTLGHTPIKVQSRSRRQHVTPSPDPNSGGSKFHGMPDFSTKIIPARQARSGTRGLPPLGFGLAGGNKGLMAVQSSSGTNENDMARPPSYLTMSFHRHSALEN